MLCALQFPFMRQESISQKLQAHFILSRDKEHLLISFSFVVVRDDGFDVVPGAKAQFENDFEEGISLRRYWSMRERKYLPTLFLRSYCMVG